MEGCGSQQTCGCSAGAMLKLHWLSKPSSVLVVAKPSMQGQWALQQVVA